MRGERGEGGGGGGAGGLEGRLRTEWNMCLLMPSLTGQRSPPSEMLLYRALSHRSKRKKRVRLMIRYEDGEMILPPEVEGGERSGGGEEVRESEEEEGGESERKRGRERKQLKKGRRRKRRRV